MAQGHKVHTFDVPKRNPKPLKFYSAALMRWTPSLMRYGVFSGCMFLYFTDWEIFMNKVPFYRKKFEPKEVLV